MARILKGSEVTAAIHEDLAPRIEALKGRGISPCLAIVRVGEKPDDIAYERGAVKRCEKLGVAVKNVLLPTDVSEELLLEKIAEINSDASVHGCLLFRPLPKHLNEDRICNALSCEKDVDGITDLSLAGVFAGKNEGFPPCTPAACMEILRHYGVDLKGKKAVVVGRSLVVGKPAAMMLLGKNATVTVCHTKTENMAAVCREADVLIAAAGRPGVIGEGFFREGQTVIDVGINVTEEGKLTGDADFAAAEPIVDAITPVPGGVGTVTTTVLVKHVVEAAERMNK